MGLSAKSKKNLVWLEKCQENYGCFLSQFIDIIKPMVCNYTNSSLEVSVGKTVDKKIGFLTLLQAKTNNVVFKIDVRNNDVILFFCDADNSLHVYTMFAINLSYVKDFNLEKIGITSQNCTFYNVNFTYQDFRYHINLKVQN